MRDKDRSNNVVNIDWRLPQPTPPLHSEPSVFVFTRLTGVADEIRS